MEHLIELTVNIMKTKYITLSELFQNSIDKNVEISKIDTVAHKYMIAHQP